MAKDISTVVADIYGLLSGEGSKLSPETSHSLGDDMVFHVDKAISTVKREPRESGKLWASDIGKPCNLALWKDFHGIEGEVLKGNVKYKFLYGNVVEELTLHLVRQSGHDVTDEQKRVELFIGGTDWKVSGKIDAVIDNTLVDVKSAASRSFDKYNKEGVTSANDTFGYRYQLAFYYHFGPESFRENIPKFLFVDKSLGHVSLVNVELPTEQEVVAAISEKVTVLGSYYPPPRAYTAVPEGKSGNMKLGTGCSYCPHKVGCWPGLRAFAYANGPVFLTEVANLPKVQEISIEQ